MATLQPPKIVSLNQSSLNIIGDGWRVYIRIIGWWRPRLQVTTYRDAPEPEIPYGEIEWTQ